jgi:hypothetical protein
MAALLAEDVDEQLGSGIDHMRLRGKGRVAVDHPQQLDHPLDAVERPERGPHVRQRIQDGESCSVSGFLDADLAVDLPEIGVCTIAVGPVTRDEQELADLDGWNELAAPGRRLGKSETKADEFFFGSQDCRPSDS